MLNCNANVIPRLSGWSKCQLLGAKAIGERAPAPEGGGRLEAGDGVELLGGALGARGQATACPLTLSLSRERLSLINTSVREGCPGNATRPPAEPRGCRLDKGSACLPRAAASTWPRSCRSHACRRQGTGPPGVTGKTVWLPGRASEAGREGGQHRAWHPSLAGMVQVQGQEAMTSQRVVLHLPAAQTALAATVGRPRDAPQLAPCLPDPGLRPQEAQARGCGRSPGLACLPPTPPGDVSGTRMDLGFRSLWCSCLLCLMSPLTEQPISMPSG